MAGLPRWFLGCCSVIGVVSIIYVEASLHVPHLQRSPSTFSASSSSSTPARLAKTTSTTARTTKATAVITTTKSGAVIGHLCE